MLFDLDFANNTILSYSSFSFLFELYFSIPAPVAQIFNPIAELLICIGTPVKEVKVEKEKHPVIIEAKIRKCST